MKIIRELIHSMFGTQPPATPVTGDEATSAETPAPPLTDHDIGQVRRLLLCLVRSDDKVLCEVAKTALRIISPGEQSAMPAPPPPSDRDWEEVDNLLSLILWSEDRVAQATAAAARHILNPQWRASRP